MKFLKLYFGQLFSVHTIVALAVSSISILILSCRIFGSIPVALNLAGPHVRNFIYLRCKHTYIAIYIFDQHDLEVTLSEISRKRCYIIKKLRIWNNKPSTTYGNKEIEWNVINIVRCDEGQEAEIKKQVLLFFF
jgi:hypothetical protein